MFHTDLSLLSYEKRNFISLQIFIKLLGTRPYSEEIIRFDRADVKPLKPRK
ncbi:unnamed protein product [Brassica oleracea var. botrytis]